MCITKCPPDCKISHPSTETKPTESCRDSITRASSKHCHNQGLIFRLARLVIPPVRVERLEVGDLYVRKRGHQKAFVVKTKNGVPEGGKMRGYEREIACERERLLRKRADLMRQKEQKLKDQPIEKSIEEIVARLKSDLLEERDSYVRQKKELERETCSVRDAHRHRSVHFADPCDTFTSTRSFTTRDEQPREYVRKRPPHVQHWTCDTNTDSDDSDESSDSDESILLGFTELRPSSTFAIPVFEDSTCKPRNPHHHSPSSSRCNDCRNYYRDSHRYRRRHDDCLSQSIIIGQPGRRMGGSIYDAGSIAVETRHPRDYRY